MKKLLAVMLILIMAFSAAACGENSSVADLSSAIKEGAQVSSVVAEKKNPVAPRERVASTPREIDSGLQTMLENKLKDTGFNGEKKRAIDGANGMRFLYTQKRPSHPGGGRGMYGALPYELPLDWASFQAAVAAAMGNNNSNKE